jgi:hypothetical protein
MSINVNFPLGRRSTLLDQLLFEEVRRYQKRVRANHQKSPLNARITKATTPSVLRIPKLAVSITESSKIDPSIQRLDYDREFATRHLLAKTTYREIVPKASGHSAGNR